MSNNLGKVISKLRKEKGLTQKELARELNVSDKAVSRWETGSSFPGLDMLSMISKYFGVSFKDLITARISIDDENDELVQEIINEFSDIKNKNAKRIKIIIAIFLIAILLLTMTMIFTNTYNKFKVYNVYIESNDIYSVEGSYVETRIKDSLFLNEIKIRDYKIKNKDTIYVDLYYIENGKEYILQTDTSLNGFKYFNHNSERKDLSEYFDNLYLRITIINSKQEIKKYEGKINFVLNFSNNKVFYKEDFVKDNKSEKLSTKDIETILLKNGFEKTSDKFLAKFDKNKEIFYNSNSNSISYNYENDNFNYRYIYYFEYNKLNVKIFNQNNSEISNYKYDITNNKILECKTGSCNDYEEVMKILNENILYLFK